MSLRTRFRQGAGRHCATRWWLLCISLVFVSAQLQGQNGWTRKADMPTGRVGATAAVVGDKIYVIGGLGAGQVDLATNEVYDPLTDSWTGWWNELEPMPTPRSFPFSGVIRDTIYVLGGGYPNPTTTKVEAYDPVTNSWDTTKAPLLLPRLGTNAAVVDGIIYAIGGSFNRSESQAYWGSPNSCQIIRTIPDSLGQKGNLSATAYNGVVYTFGGSNYSPWSPLPQACAYDPQSDSWTRKSPLPTSRFGLQTYLVRDKIYAIGGSQSYGTALATVELYDPLTNTWDRLPDMPIRNVWFAGAVLNDKIYVIGGLTNGAVISAELWEYDPSFHTDIAAGNVSGTWTFENSPYHVLGEITIPNDSTLLIEPGVEVVFLGHYKLNVQGRLLAVGTPKDTIRFTAENMETGWHGIRFMDTPSSNDTSQMFYCSFKYGMANTGSGYDRCGGAMMIKAFDKVLVSHCLFDSNMQSGDGFSPIIEAGPAIYVYHASPRITNSTFSHHTGSKGGAILCLSSPKAIISNNVVTKNRGAWVGAIVSYGSGSPTISGNIIFDNFAGIAGGGISVEKGASPRIENNIIIHNQAPGAGGIVCWSNTNAVLVNNTIAYNIATNAGGGIGCTENSDPILVNNIIYGNIAPQSSQVNINDVQSDPHFLYCSIERGKEGFSGIGAGANYDGLYVNNIDSDPLFRDTASVDYRLKESSPCIGAGVDSVLVTGNWIHAPLFCNAGNARPSPAGSMPDVGACENLSGTPIVGVAAEEAMPAKYLLHQNYPNPFNPSTTIKYELPKSSVVRLSVYDILGREVLVLVNERRDAGVHEIKYDGSGLSSGVYLYRLTVGSFVETRKLVLVR